MLTSLSILAATCLPPTFAERTGRELCWVRFRIADQVRICVDRKSWNQLLAAPERRCGNWEGKWKTYSPPKNHPNDPDKTIYQEFRVKRLPDSGFNPSFWIRFVHKIEEVRERISERIRPHDPSGMFRKLIVNEKTPGSPEALYRTLGFVHVATAAGIHLYALGRLVQRVCAWIGSSTRLPVPMVIWISRLLTLGVAGFAWLIEGARPGFLRPWLVIGLRFVGRRVGIQWTRFSPLLLAIGVDLSIALARHFSGLPGAWAPGRWHYALAVGGGLLAIDHVRRGGRRPGAFREHLALSVGSWLPTAVWDAWEIGSIAIATPVLSLITIPAFSTLTFPLGLASLHLPDQIFSAGMAVSNRILETTALLSMSLSTLWIVPAWSMLVAAPLAGLALLLPSCWRPLILVPTLAAQFIPRPQVPLIQLDVGQGDATWVSQEKTGLIDTGSEWAWSEAAWIRFLASQSANRIDWIAISHLDEDHSGAARKLARLVPIGCVATSKRQWNTPRGESLRLHLQKHTVSTATWEQSCYPYAWKEVPSQRKNNSDMTAFAVPLPDGGTYLNAGDSNRDDERILKTWYLDFPRPYILKISHHGSAHSTSRNWIRALRPREAWISSGLGNPYGHPRSRVLDLLKEENVPFRRTDTEGMISWR